MLFFFQAEDGIRDFHVTGVQTCALPICLVEDVGPESLEKLEASLERDRPDLLKALYPYEPPHLLTKRECDELFDTTPDLSGADLDISRFIRSGEERDLFVCWVPEAPSPEVQPTRDGLCPVPVYAAKKW